MNGSSIFIDTNTAIYLLNGDKNIADILDQKKLNLSFITQLELLSYPGITDKEKQQIQRMLEKCIIIDINNSIKNEVIRLRKIYKMKLPDCIVAASALYLDLPLLIAGQDFKKIKELNLMFYER